MSLALHILTILNINGAQQKCVAILLRVKNTQEVSLDCRHAFHFTRQISDPNCDESTFYAIIVPRTQIKC